MSVSAVLPLFSGACLYVLTGSEARIGKTTGLDARLRDHRRAMPMPRIDQIFAIASPGFNSDAITTLEAILTQAVRKAGVMPVVGTPLRVPALDPARDRDLLHWLGELPPLLLAAGCSVFDSDFAPAAERAVEAAAPINQLSATIGSGAVRQGWDEGFPADLLRSPATLHFVLERGGLRAEAAVQGPWTVLKRGSLLTAAADTSDQIGVSRKRARLRELGLLEPAGSFQRLTRDIAVPSLTNGARLASGTNAPPTVWRAL